MSTYLTFTKAGKLINKLPVCGCGRPELSYEVFRKWLHYCKVQHTIEYENHDQFYKELYKDKICKEVDKAIESDSNDEAMYAIVNEVLDKLGCTEHGSSWYGSWLTKKGEDMLKALNEAEEYDYDFSPEVGWYYKEVEDK